MRKFIKFVGRLSRRAWGDFWDLGQSLVTGVGAVIAAAVGLLFPTWGPIIISALDAMTPDWLTNIGVAIGVAVLLLFCVARAAYHLFTEQESLAETERNRATEAEAQRDMARAVANVAAQSLPAERLRVVYDRLLAHGTIGELAYPSGPEAWNVEWSRLSEQACTFLPAEDSSEFRKIQPDDGGWDPNDPDVDYYREQYKYSRRKMAIASQVEFLGLILSGKGVTARELMLKWTYPHVK